MIASALAAWTLALASFISLPAHADIYKYVDENGVVHLSDRRLTPQYKLLLSTAKRLGRYNPAAYSINRRKFTDYTKYR